jgi:MFS family permease
MSGWLSAYFGRRRYLTGSIMLFVAASFMCGAATSLGGLVLWRVIQGLGGGALLSTAQATLFESFPPEEVGIGQAMFGVGVMVGPTIGPTLGGWITDNYNWPWIFYINVPLGILAALMVLSYVRDAAHQERANRIDIPGILLLAMTVGSLQWMLERGERYDWFESRFVTALGVIALVSGVALIWRELTTDEPIIDFSVLRSRQLATGVMFAAALGLALYGGVFVLPIFLQSLHGFTAWQTGKVILPGALASAFTMAIVGRNAQKLDARYTIVGGAALFMMSMWLMSRITLDSGTERSLLATRASRRGAGSHLRAAHERVDGRAVRAAACPGDGTLQPDAPARRLARHRAHGDAAVAIHGDPPCDPHGACRGDRHRGPGADRHDRQWADGSGHKSAVGQAAGALHPRSTDLGTGERARVLEDLPPERHHPVVCIAVVVAVEDRARSRKQRAGALGL